MDVLRSVRSQEVDDWFDRVTLLTREAHEDHGGRGSVHFFH